MSGQIVNNSYKEVLEIIKKCVYESQYRAFRAVNKELLNLYWEIGKIIVEKQEKEKWGRSVVERLAKDLQVEFPGIKGFSQQNVWRMRQFYSVYSKNQKLSQLVREIPWGQNLVIISKCKEQVIKEFYIKMVIRYSLSRSVLEERIRSKEFERWALKQDNYERTLPEVIAKHRELINRDEYNLDFLGIGEEASEKDLERAISKNIVKFLAIMGGDFAFVGRQFPIRVDEDEFFIDLLFFHRKLKSLIAIELKAGKFDPRDVGQMGLYLAALDEYYKAESENPALGIIICRSKNRKVVDLSLRFVAKPIGIATYKTYDDSSSLPETLHFMLPSVNELQKRLEEIIV